MSEKVVKSLPTGVSLLHEKSQPKFLSDGRTLTDVTKSQSMIAALYMLVYELVRDGYIHGGQPPANHVFEDIDKELAKLISDPATPTDRVLYYRVVLADVRRLRINIQEISAS